jgi:hypothetical protein
MKMTLRSSVGVVEARINARGSRLEVGIHNKIKR